MTKEDLNVLIKNKIDFKIVMTKDNCNIEIITGDLIDELLALFKQEVAIEKRMGEKKAEKLLNQIEELTAGKCSLRCPLVLHEKKEIAKEIMNKVLSSFENSYGNHTVWSGQLWECVEDIAKEYGVEL